MLAWARRGASGAARGRSVACPLPSARGRASVTLARGAKGGGDTSGNETSELNAFRIAFHRVRHSQHQSRLVRSRLGPLHDPRGSTRQGGRFGGVTPRQLPQHAVAAPCSTTPRPTPLPPPASYREPSPSTPAQSSTAESSEHPTTTHLHIRKMSRSPLEDARGKRAGGRPEDHMERRPARLARTLRGSRAACRNNQPPLHRSPMADVHTATISTRCSTPTRSAALRV